MNYCCKGDGSEIKEGEEEKPDLAKTLSSPAHWSTFPILPHALQPSCPPSPQSALTSPRLLSIIPLTDNSSSKQLLTTAGLHKTSGPAICRHYNPALSLDPICSYMFCPTCYDLLPFYLVREQKLRNGGRRISYRNKM